MYKCRVDMLSAIENMTEYLISFEILLRLLKISRIFWNVVYRQPNYTR